MCLWQKTTPTSSQGHHVLLMRLRYWLNSFIELCLHELLNARLTFQNQKRHPHLPVRSVHTLLVIHSPLCTKLTVTRSYITLIAMALLDFGSGKGCRSIVCSSEWRSVSFSSLWSIFSAIISVLGGTNGPEECLSYIITIHHNRASLASLLQAKPKSLSWNTQASSDFQRVRDAFTSVRIFVHPGPVRLVQTRKLTPVKQSYDIGNLEIFAIQCTLDDQTTLIHTHSNAHS